MKIIMFCCQNKKCFWTPNNVRGKFWIIHQPEAFVIFGWLPFHSHHVQRDVTMSLIESIQMLPPNITIGYGWLNPVQSMKPIEPIKKTWKKGINFHPWLNHFIFKMYITFQVPWIPPLLLPNLQWPVRKKPKIPRNSSCCCWCTSQWHSENLKIWQK